MLIYRKWSGAFESALIVKNGKGIKRALLTKFAPRFKKASFEGEGEVCGTFDLLEWFQDCYYEGDNPEPYYCSEPYSEVIGQIDIPCPEDDPEYDPCLEPENFELCFPGGSEGGGGGDENQPPVLDYGSSTSEFDSEEPVEYDYTDGADTIRYKRVNWVFCDGKIWKFKSREQIGQIKNDSPWKWLYITHITEYVTGQMYNGEVFIDGFDWDKEQSTTFVKAKVEWRTRITLNEPFGGYTSYGDTEEADYTWSTF